MSALLCFGIGAACMWLFANRRTLTEDIARIRRIRSCDPATLTTIGRIAQLCMGGYREANRGE